MRVSLHPGKYVIAVSGGVDSVLLLDLLAGQAGVKLIVAHFDHGIRDDSRDDRVFVQELARKYNLPFVYDEGKLGKGASEALARDARYGFLRRVKEATEAQAMVTAHHENDLLETAILNMLRGTGRKGLSSLQSTREIYRPLLTIPKQIIVEEARKRGLEWHEDSTNADTKYLRNYVRHNIVPRFDSDSRQQLRSIVDKAQVANAEIDIMVSNLLHVQPATDELDRYWFTLLPHAVSREVMAGWLRARGATELNKNAIERMVAMAKVLPVGKRIDVDALRSIVVKSDNLALTYRDR